MTEFSKLADKIKGMQTYVQACEAVPQLMESPALATNFLLKDRIGVGYANALIVNEKDYANVIYDVRDLKNVADFIINAEKNHAGQVKKWVSEWEKDKNEFVKTCKKLETRDLTNLTNRELSQAYVEFKEKYEAEWSLSIMIDGFNLHAESIARHELIRILKKQGQEKKFAEYFSALTTPSRKSFAIECRESLLELLKEVNQGIIRQTTDFASEKDLRKLFENPSVKKLVEKHLRNFHWVRNSYLRAKPLTEDDIAIEIHELITEKTEAEKELKKIDESVKNALKKKNSIKNELNLTDDFKQLIELVDVFSWWQDERKKHNLIGDHYLTRLLDETASRLNVTYYEIAYASKQELIEALEKGAIGVEELRKRRKLWVYACIEGNLKMYSGQEAFEIKKLLNKTTQETGDVRGQCASIGRVQGFVKIVNTAEEIKKMKKGDVLVSSMTRPELVPAMKLAAAVVTDEGGITSHAAIISRELGIPCVIGTKIATKVFKDGDFVEVDANHSVMRKVME